MTRSRTLAWAGAGVATGMTVLWTFVVPDKAETTPGLQALAIRHGHPATWAALAVLGVMVALDAPSWTRTTAAAVSMISYGFFLVAVVL